MAPALTTVELFLIAMAVIFTVPFLIWRFGRTDYWAPMVVVQIVTGVVLGPGLLGQWWPEGYRTIFTPAVIQALNGLAWWAVMLFVFLAGLELDLKKAWDQRRSTLISAGLALGVPLACGCAAALVLQSQGGWVGPRAQPWQFVAGIGMACAVTALPILVFLMEKL
ncbi:MAG: cation:proton antiporter, partial [Betaproteobacteria bacterium]